MRQFLAAMAAAIAFLASSASAAISGYLEIPDIPGESRGAVSNNEALTVGANETETIKGGKAVIIGALWNGSEAPPRRNSKGTVKLKLQRGALSASLSRLKDQKRAIPKLKLVTDGQVGPKTYVLQNVLVKSYAVRGSSASAYEEVVLVFEVLDWEDVR